MFLYNNISFLCSCRSGSSVLGSSVANLDYKPVQCRKLHNGNDRSSMIRSSADCASTTELDKSLSVAEDVVIAQSSRLARGSKVGKDSYLSRNVRLGPGVLIGERVCIEAGAILPRNTKIGNDYLVIASSDERGFAKIAAHKDMTYEMIDGHCIEVKQYDIQ